MRRLATSDARIDWFRVLDDLRRHGLPNAQVAKRIGVPTTTLLGWKQGAEPKHTDGELLLDLWVGITGSNRHQAPRQE